MCRSGARSSFDVLNRSVPQPLTFSPVPPSPTGWTLLAETVQQQHASPAMLEMISVLPAANGRLAANMAAFVAAARSGDGRWPGETSLKALERSGPRGTALARFLRGEILSKSPSASRPESQGAGGAGAGEEWHTLTMPFLNGETIEKITLSLHRPPDDPAEEEPRRDGRKGGVPMRFLIDLTLSVLGPVQIDGLAKPGERRFDLVLRTRMPLPQEMRRDITGLFATAGTLLNLGGSL